MKKQRPGLAIGNFFEGSQNETSFPLDLDPRRWRGLFVGKRRRVLRSLIGYGGMRSRDDIKNAVKAETHPQVVLVVVVVVGRQDVVRMRSRNNLLLECLLLFFYAAPCPISW